MCFVHLGDPARNIRSTLPVPPGRKSYVGLTLDYARGCVTFHVNGKHESVTVTTGARSMAGTSATLAGPNLTASGLATFEGQLAAFAFYGANRLTDAEHDQLFQTRSVVLPQAPPTLLLTPADTAGLARDFVLPTATAPTPESVQAVRCDTGTILTFTGAASAGVELGANERTHGDTVEFQFAFRLDRGTGQTLCTVGDANRPARVFVRGPDILLSADGQMLPCGAAAPGTWQHLTVSTRDAFTCVTLDQNPPAEVRHNPEATWLYLGDGYRAAVPAGGTAFSVDVQSVRSRVTPGTQRAPTEKQDVSDRP
jgi:hypothetical protein